MEHDNTILYPHKVTILAREANRHDHALDRWFDEHPEIKWDFRYVDGVLSPRDSLYEFFFESLTDATQFKLLFG